MKRKLLFIVLKPFEIATIIFIWYHFGGFVQGILESGNPVTFATRMFFGFGGTAMLLGVGALSYALGIIFYEANKWLVNKILGE